MPPRWREWLGEQPRRPGESWLWLAKKGDRKARPDFTSAQAPRRKRFVHGWIARPTPPASPTSHLRQRFTPRRKRSAWSEERHRIADTPSPTKGDASPTAMRRWTKRKPTPRGSRLRPCRCELSKSRPTSRRLSPRPSGRRCSKRSHRTANGDPVQDPHTISKRADTAPCRSEFWQC